MNTPLRNDQPSIGITNLSYRLPATRKTLRQLEQDKALDSPASLLSEFGFESCYVLGEGEELTPLLNDSASSALLDESRSEVKAVILYSGMERSGDAVAPARAVELFRYPVAQLQDTLGLPNANAIALSQQGCSGFLSAICMAQALLATSENEQATILCAAADGLPAGLPRDVMYNVMSDAASAVLVKRTEQNRIIHFHQETQAYYWDTPMHETELLAAYFPMAQRTIERALKESGLTLGDIDWFVPHNVSLRSWEILSKLLGIPMEKIWTNNIARVGHTVSSDHIINLVDMERAGILVKGSYLLLFTFGFGASWTCLILKH